MDDPTTSIMLIVIDLFVCVDSSMLEKKMVTHSNTFAWRTSCTEGPGELQFMGLQRVKQDLVTYQQQQQQFPAFQLALVLH